MSAPVNVRLQDQAATTGVAPSVYNLIRLHSVKFILGIANCGGRLTWVEIWYLPVLLG